MMHLRGGIFDEASVSVIATETIREIGTLAGRALDVRRFRPNIVVRLLRPNPFEEDQWLGGVLLFGEPGDGPRVSVTTRDVRCAMVNFDPDSGRADPEVLKSIVVRIRTPPESTAPSFTSANWPSDRPSIFSSSIDE